MLDPFTKVPTLVMIGDIATHHQAALRARPRYVARKAQNYLKYTGSPTPLLRREAEFFVFDNVRFDTTANTSFYFIDAKKGAGTPDATGTRKARRKTSAIAAL